jgi:hypothetical protein
VGHSGRPSLAHTGWKVIGVTVTSIPSFNDGKAKSIVSQATARNGRNTKQKSRQMFRHDGPITPRIVKYWRRLQVVSSDGCSSQLKRGDRNLKDPDRTTFLWIKKGLP